VRPLGNRLVERPMATPSELDPTSLNREIAQLETEMARLEIGRAAAARSVAKLRRSSFYLRSARALRAPAGSFGAYRVMLLAVGPLVIGVVALVLFSLFINSWLVAFGGFLLAVISGCGLLASLLYQPSDAQLPFSITETDSQLVMETAQLQEATAAVTVARQQLEVLREQQRGFAKSDKLQRAMLLQRNWKTLRGSEWEDYVVEVCRTLGANVQRGDKTGLPPSAPGAPASGPRGVIRREATTLYVTFSPRRIAVAAVSEVNPFHPAAVRQVIDDLARQGCEDLGIITNARITEGGKEFARSRRCTLIGEEEFPDFVLGKLPL
jgi:hypothetical protein